MQIGFVGLGKMGLNMTRRLIAGGHTVAATDLNESALREAAEAGAQTASSISALVGMLEAPRIVWIMVPAGNPTQAVIDTLANQLSAGDILIDGGNSNYKETQQRGEALTERGIHFVDVGTSGGIWGLKEGYSLMIGGPEAATDHLKPIFETLAPAPDRGWGRVGPTGAGHFVKMIHNGIEYGMMQAFAEGFEIMQARSDMGLDVHQIAQIWQHGSVVRSWLLDLTVNALAEDASLSDIAGYVPDSGEGRWTVAEALDLDIPAPVITLALLQRFASRQSESYAAKLLAALRNQFGGHAVKKVDS